MNAHIIATLMTVIVLIGVAYVVGMANLFARLDERFGSRISFPIGVAILVAHIWLLFYFTPGRMP